MAGLEKFADSKISELSGGMKQRVGIARALVVEPQVILMDEPFGALDAQTRTIMQAQLIEILRNTNQTIIFITHSMDEPSTSQTVSWCSPSVLPPSKRSLTALGKGPGTVRTRVQPS